jgi:hypothetical protein
MNEKIERLKKIRLYLFDILKDLTIKQLNQIPTGINNNIAWHLGHMLVSQQGICYLRAGLPTFIDEQLYLKYKPGTKPEAFIDNAEIDNVINLMIAALDQLENDYQDNLFTNYNQWTTRYGVELRNIDDAIDFLLYHEGLHTGYIMVQKRLVTS